MAKSGRFGEGEFVAIELSPERIAEFCNRHLSLQQRVEVQEALLHRPGMFAILVRGGEIFESERDVAIWALNLARVAIHGGQA